MSATCRALAPSRILVPASLTLFTVKSLRQICFPNHQVGGPESGDPCATCFCFCRSCPRRSFCFFGSRKPGRLSGGRSVSPSLVRLTRGDIESVSARRRENFEIAASKTPFNVTSQCIRRSLWLLFRTRLEFVLRSVRSRRRKRRKDSLNEKRKRTQCSFLSA